MADAAAQRDAARVSVAAETARAYVLAAPLPRGTGSSETLRKAGSS